MLYVVKLIPYDKKHKWKHYKKLINLIKRSHNAVITTEFIWFIELEEISLDRVCHLYNDYIEPKDKVKVEIAKDTSSKNIYLRSVNQLPS